MAKNLEPYGLRPPVPTEEGLPLYEAAREAHAEGRSVFHTSLIVATTKGSGGFSLRGGKRGAHGQTWDPGHLIEAIEGLGWRLTQLDHTWYQTEHNAAINGATAMIEGITTANMLFRRHE